MALQFHVRKLATMVFALLNKLRPKTNETNCHLIVQALKEAFMFTFAFESICLRNECNPPAWIAGIK